MYWAKIRHGSTPRVMCTPMSRWSGVPTSSGAHRRRDADGGRFVAAARIERARDLALPVQDVPALLDAAGDQHVAVDAEEVLAVEALLPSRPAASRWARLRAQSPLHSSRRGGRAVNRNAPVTLVGVGKAADWLREERRNVLGHWRRSASTAARPAAGSSTREADVPETCACGGTILRRCPACEAPFSSTFAVDCEECGEPLRSPSCSGCASGASRRGRLRRCRRLPPGRLGRASGGFEVRRLQDTAGARLYLPRSRSSA